MKTKLDWFFIVFVILAIGGVAHAASITWTNTAGGNWSVAANWNPNQVPGAADTAQITTSGTYTVTNSATASVSVLTLGGASGTQTLDLSSGTFTVGSASTGNAQGVLNLNGGTLAGAGALTLAGPFTWSSGLINNTGGVTLNGTSSLSGAGSGSMGLSGLLINAGSLTWSGGANNLYMEGGTLTNLAAGTVTITADVSAVNAGGGTIGNAGLLKKTTTTGTTTIGGGIAFINPGDVQVQSGTLDFAGGGSASGTFEVSASATLQFGGGYTLSAASSVTGAGTVLMTSGTVNLTGNLSLSGTNIISGGTLTVNTPASMAVTNLILSSGTLGGNAAVVVAGPFNWSSGTINNTGGVTLNGTSSLSGAGSGSMGLSGLLINAGSLTWSGGANNLYMEGGTLTNLAAGTVTITADVSAVNAGGGTIGNAGLLKKTTTTGTTTIGGGIAFINPGDVQVQSGTLDFAGGGSASGTFEVSASATLQFGGGYTLSAASSVTGAGSAIYSAGTINASGTYDPTGGNTFSGATVNFSGNYTITGQAVTLSSGAVNFNAGGTVNLTGLTLSGGALGGTLPVPVNGPFTWSGGTINNTGGVTLNGTSSLSGAGSGSMGLSGLLINAGSLTWSGGANNLYMEGGTLTNLAAGTVTITADVSAVNAGGGTIGNAGLLKKTTTTGTTTIGGGIAFINPGDVQVQSGTLDFAGGGSASGTFEVSASATLQFGGGYTLSAASSVTGAGTVLMTSGTVNLTGNLSLSGTNIISGGTLTVNTPASMAVTNLILSSGTLGGNAAVVVAGPFNWSSGTINNTGGVTLNGTSSLSGVGAGSMGLSGLLINGGALTWSGGANNLYMEGGTLTNLAAGTVTITADVSAVNAGGGTIGNAGLLKKTTTTGTTTIGGGIAFINPGDVQVQSGTLDFAGGGSASGTFEVSASATLQFGGGYTLSAASSVTGAGSAIYSAGTINASGTYDPTGGNTFSGATVNFSGNYTITGQAVTLSSGAVNFNAGGTVNLTGLTLSGGALGGTLPVPVNGPFTWSGGTINNTGGVTLNGTSSLSGAGSGSMGLSGLLINAGSLTWSGGANNLYMEGGTLTNLAAGTVTITADVSAVNAGGGTIGNAGLLKKTTTTGTTTIGGGIAFINPGDVQVQSGTLDFAGGGSASGTFEVSASATLQFGGGYTLSAASSVTGAGTVLMTSGTVNLTGNLSLSGTNIISGGTLTVNTPASMAVTNLILSSGTLGGNAAVVVAGPFNWSSGTINNTGGVTLNGTSSLSGVGAGSMGLSGLLINGGALTWSGGANNLYMEGGTLTNLAAGTVTITADVSAVNAGGGTIGNAGLLRKTTTTGTTTIGGGIAYVNSGTLDVQSGIISLAGTHILTNGTINFGISNATSFGSVTLSSAAALTGTLSANFNGGFLPAVNNSWQIMNFTSPSGVFTQTNLPPVAVWQVTTNSTSLTIKVLKLVPQMSWTNPADIVYGTALSASQLDATASWNGSAVPGIFTYTPPLSTVLESGSNQTLSVSFAPSDPTTYTNTITTVAINVQKAPLGVTATNQTKTYGQNFTFAGTEFVSSGLVNGDTVTSASIASAGAVSNAPVSGSPYAITISGAQGDAGLTNYIITYTNGLLTVNPAPLGITANSRSKTYGQNITFAGTEFTPSGLQNLETIATVTLTSAGAISNAPVSGSPYSIVPSAATGGTFTPGNYAITYTNGTLSVNRAGLSVTANNAVRTYGATNPVFSASYSGFVNNENISVVSGVPGFSTPATVTSPVGGYAITPSLGSLTAANYAFGPFNNGTLTINTALLGLTATNRSKTYGQNIVFAGTEFVSSGLVNGDTVTSASLASAGAISNAPVSGSPYAITITNAVGNAGLTNYSITYTNGVLTVNKALLGITATNRSKTYGQNIIFAGTEFVSSPLQNAETIGTVTLTSAGAISNAPVSGSPYSIVPSAATGGTFTAGNYTIGYTNGVLTVNKATLTITANSTNKIAGETWTFAGTEFTASGLQNLETVGTVALVSAGTPSSAPAGPYNIVPSAPVGGTFSQGNYSDIFVDGTLTVLGEPELTLTALGSQYVLSFPSVSGQMYQLQSKTNLALAAWSSLGGTINGTGGTVDVTNTIVVPQSFFQLQITP